MAERFVPEVSLETERQAMALIGMQFGLGLLVIMVRHGVLTREEAIQQLEMLLSSVETLSDGDESRAARKMIEAMATGMAGGTLPRNFGGKSPGA